MCTIGLDLAGCAASVHVSLCCRPCWLCIVGPRTLMPRSLLVVHRRLVNSFVTGLFRRSFGFVRSYTTTPWTLSMRSHFEFISRRASTLTRTISPKLLVEGLRDLLCIKLNKKPLWLKFVHTSLHFSNHLSVNASWASSLVVSQGRGFHYGSLRFGQLVEDFICDC